MARPISPTVEISETAASILDKIIKSGRSEKRHVDRAQIILLSAQPNKSNLQIALEESTSPNTVKKWRYRWLEQSPTFTAIMNQSDKSESKKLKELEEQIMLSLSDKPRPGAPMTFTADQYCQLLSVALEKPEQSNRPINDWTSRELADEVIKLKGSFSCPIRYCFVN